jgi:hypothetical protein
MSMRLNSLSHTVMSGPGAATAPVIGGRLLAWTLVAAVLAVVAIYAAAVAPAPDVNTAIDLIGP